MKESCFDIGMKVRKEILLHVAVYAGVPAANTAFSTAKKAFDQYDHALEEVNSSAISQEDV